MKTFADVVQFHGHACPGLAFGFRVAEAALARLGPRSSDEELVAVVENRSCAVDAIQVMTGCTFGKGNLLVNDYGKQAYTFMARPSGRGVRIAVIWEAPPESAETKALWQRFAQDDQPDGEVKRAIKALKGAKMQAILQADPQELFVIREITGILPEKARVYPSLRCAACGEKVMEPRIRAVDGRLLCIPCREADGHSR